MKKYSDLNVSQRILLGPGPSQVSPRVLRAMAHPLVGHLDPQFINLMNEVQELLRFAFQTKNALTIPISGTGSAGMEAALCNFIEPGDSVLVGVNGYFGERLCDMADRYGGEVRRLELPWGEVFTTEDLENALKEKPAKLVALVHAETSTGARQNLEGMAEIVHNYGGILVLDCVTSLGGIPVKIDKWGVDVAYSGTQKCLSCPPGLGPLTISPRAVEVLKNRKTKVANWYLDLTMIQKYWGSNRTYHHTAPISMNYALREALRLVYEEGLDKRFDRHQENAEMLWEGLESLGLDLQIPSARRLPTLTTVKIPDGVDGIAVQKELLERYNIEIAGGLGEFAGQVWRIGLMGYSSRPENILALLSSLERLLG
jgi:alanine-glyoxylate transaminase/serine-glyoxylate transaminase/serine-pyruvate transaminase